MSDALEQLDMAFYEEAWDYLNRDAIALAKQVQKLVNAGVAPEAIRRRVVQTAGTHREPIAIRCENAAKFLYAAKGKV